MTLGEKLRSLRLKEKKTLKDMSTELGISLNSVYRWESNMVFPRKPMLKILAERYNVTVDYLLSENTETSLIDDIERDLLASFRRLPEKNKFRVIGYIERMCAEV